MELKDLAAPCGIFCGACRSYLLLKKDLLEKKGYKTGCKGCRVRNKNCAFIKRDCPYLKKKEVQYCFECVRFPCQNLIKINNTYKEKYSVSLIKNLERMREVGVEKWLSEQQALYKCIKCGGEVCVHDEECFDCGYQYNPNKM